MGDTSVFLPMTPAQPERILPFAGMVRWGSAVRLWQGQSLAADPGHLFTYAAASGFRVPFGHAVTPFCLRHPLDAAIGIRQLAMSSGHPVAAGFGTGAAHLQRAVHGSVYRSPLTAAEEYLTILKGLLERGRARESGTYFSCDAELPPLPGPASEIGLGVLRPGMARLAGGIADSAITWLAGPTHIASTLIPALERGASEAGRARPRVVSVVPIALAAEGRDPTTAVFAAVGMHLRLPHYVAALARAGVRVEGRPSEEVASSLLQWKIFLHGTPEEIAEGVAAYRAAGVDEIVLNTSGVNLTDGTEQTLIELERIFKAIE